MTLKAACDILVTAGVSSASFWADFRPHEKKMRAVSNKIEREYRVIMDLSSKLLFEKLILPVLHPDDSQRIGLQRQAHLFSCCLQRFGLRAYSMRFSNGVYVVQVL